LDSYLLLYHSMTERRRRFAVIVILAFITLGGIVADTIRSQPPLPVINGATTKAKITPDQIPSDTTLAGNILETLAIKGRAPKTGYSRKQFGDGWAELGACDVRNHVLARDMTGVVYRSPTDCTVMSGTLQDPYTGKTINFVRGPTGSSAVQIDHVVALSNAWQTGAQQLSKDQRMQLANDPLELLAVDGPANQQKSDADAATWLPSNKDYRCRYVARQIAVRKKYSLWVVPAERDTMRRILATCPGQLIPVVQEPIQ
jgi:hypothetical protein